MSSEVAPGQPAPLVGLIAYLGRRISQRSESALAPLGLRLRHLVTLTMLRDQGGCSQRSLGSMLAMDGTNVVGLLNELEADGLITRRRSPEDRRRHVVELTDAGRERLSQAECAMAAVENEILDRLDVDQRAAFHSLLRTAAGVDEVDCSEAAGC